MHEITGVSVSLLSADTMRVAIGPGFLADNTVIANITCEASLDTEYYAVGNKDGKLPDRSRATIWFIENILRKYANIDYLRESEVHCCSLTFQGDDCPKDLRSVSWQTKTGYKNVCLAPDFYYFGNQGQIDESKILPWPKKLPKAFWRGSTTGALNITTCSLVDLPRFALCKAGLEFGSKADFGITSVVQSKTAADKDEIEAFLDAMKFSRSHIPFESQGDYKFVIQIDGNGNSWHLIRKLRMGSCLLIVDSDWILWHARYLHPWEHYIPVARDLSDLGKSLDWCFLHDDEARRIGERGRRLALSLDFRNEMEFAAKSILEHASATPRQEQLA